MNRVKITVVHHRSQHTPLAILNQLPLGVIGYYLQERAVVDFVFVQDIDIGKALESDFVVIMGAMESVNDSTVSWLAHEARLIKNLLNHQVRLFGICFGAQHIAKILGGSVYKMVNPIVRLSDISLNRDGKLHPIFCGFPDQFKAISLHQDYIQLPLSAVPLAEGSGIMQAFSYENVVGVQFHPEITSGLLNAFIQKRIKRSLAYHHMIPECLLLKQRAAEYEKNLLHLGELLADNILASIEEKV
ncbi:MAG: type 1 glutamine amidotransferase [Gammaproteobacteria bacterium]|jgi:GMP synthase-like glutamine amidotransferase|nr:type 1 glutamine amidotransferase [Gammaproteobacteria bacterium]